MRRDFPDDPERLYVTARFLSQLANRAAQELSERFPASIQVAKMNAEALESRRMWDQAIEAYRKILEQAPTLPDIRYRIASIMLDREFNAESVAQATKELEQELKINPNSASAEFVLGEIARRAGDWPTAIKRFARAGELDAGFLEAHLALGMSLNADSKYAEAVAPLERYVKGAPDDPAGHYQLATTYSRLGEQDRRGPHGTSSAGIIKGRLAATAECSSSEIKRRMISRRRFLHHLGQAGLMTSLPRALERSSAIPKFAGLRRDSR